MHPVATGFVPMFLPATDYVSPFKSSRRPLIIWLVVAGIALLMMLMVIGAPLAQASGHSSLAFAIYGAFGKLCHQLPERSFFIAGQKFAVCARCTGLYLGFTSLALLYPLLKSLKHTDSPPRRWLFIAAVPMAVDFFLGYFGIWDNTHLSRFLTGFLLGGVVVFFVMPGLLEIDLVAWRQLFKRNSAALP